MKTSSRINFRADLGVVYDIDQKATEMCGARFGPARVESGKLLATAKAAYVSLREAGAGVK